MGTTHFTSVEVTEDLVAADDITSTDDIVAGDDLTVTDDAAVGGDLAVTGAATVGGTLGVTGVTTLSDVATVGGNFSVIPGTTGGVALKIKEAVSAALSGGTVTITLDVPVGARVIGAQLRVETLITSGDGATSWTATLSGGLTTQIAATLAFTKNTKEDVFLDVNAAAVIVTSSVANIAITPNSNTFSAGVVRAIVYYEEFIAMADAA